MPCDWLDVDCCIGDNPTAAPGHRPPVARVCVASSLPLYYPTFRFPFFCTLLTHHCFPPITNRYTTHSGYGHRYLLHFKQPDFLAFVFVHLKHVSVENLQEDVYTCTPTRFASSQHWLREFRSRSSVTVSRKEPIRRQAASWNVDQLTNLFARLAASNGIDHQKDQSRWRNLVSRARSSSRAATKSRSWDME